MHVLSTILTGPALSYFRKNETTFANTKAAMAGLEAQFGPSEEGLKNELEHMTFNPNIESLRNFNSRFNAKIDATSISVAQSTLI